MVSRKVMKWRRRRRRRIEGEMRTGGNGGKERKVGEK